MKTLSRRRLLSSLAAMPMASALGGAAQPPKKIHGEKEAAPRRKSARRRGRVVVIGAGAFGGWSALFLQRSGYQVTLVDAWGPGNSRASSGGDTRVIRGMYGPDQIYTDWVVQSFERWTEEARRWNLDLYHPTGTLWMFRVDDAYAKASLPFLRRAGLAVESLTPEAAAKRWPQVSMEGIRSVYFEEKAGYLRARVACQAVAEALVREGGEFILAEARPGTSDGSRLEAVALSDGRNLVADHFVFACGPWLGKVFPEAVGTAIQPTRQDAFFFGPPASPSPFDEGRLPIWIDFGERVFYGIPGNRYRGFKLADDTHGEAVDPSTLDRRPSETALDRARKELALRFPAMAGAPLLEARVCQYETTRDGHYLIDRHPEFDNLWLVGGGSGHGFKLGPAVGQHVTELLKGEAELLPRFSLARLADKGQGPSGSQFTSGASERTPD